MNPSPARLQRPRWHQAPPTNQMGVAGVEPAWAVSAAPPVPSRMPMPFGYTPRNWNGAEAVHLTTTTSAPFPLLACSNRFFAMFEAKVLGLTRSHIPVLTPLARTETTDCFALCLSASVRISNIRSTMVSACKGVADVSNISRITTGKLLPSNSGRRMGIFGDLFPTAANPLPRPPSSVLRGIDGKPSRASILLRLTIYSSHRFKRRSMRFFSLCKASHSWRLVLANPSRVSRVLSTTISPPFSFVCPATK